MRATIAALMVLLGLITSPIIAQKFSFYIPRNLNLSLELSARVNVDNDFWLSQVNNKFNSLGVSTPYDYDNGKLCWGISSNYGYILKGIETIGIYAPSTSKTLYPTMMPSIKSTMIGVHPVSFGKSFDKDDFGFAIRPLVEIGIENILFTVTDSIHNGSLANTLNSFLNSPRKIEIAASNKGGIFKLKTGLMFFFTMEGVVMYFSYNYLLNESIRLQYLGLTSNMYRSEILGGIAIPIRKVVKLIVSEKNKR